MLFNSLTFVTYFIVVWIITILLNRIGKVQYRNAFLLLASYVFYGSFDVTFLLVLVYVTIINFIGGICLQHHVRKKTTLVTIVILSLLPLLIYKYSEFFLYDILSVPQAESTKWVSNLVLPVGISFFTFQALTYTLDLYREKIECNKDLLSFSLFVAFFPTVLSGPIEKARNLFPQISSITKITTVLFVSGARLFIWGLFKKVVVADRLATYVDWVYSNVDYLEGATLVLAAVFYSIQIYCDFSGYSDMAVGVARCLGFDLFANFKFPYLSTSIKSFWKKWHISLTSWFTEYVYFSLGGNRVHLKIRWMFNISMVFILSGIWHGAAWNFLVWGIIHAVLYLVEYFIGLQKKGFAFKHVFMKIVAGIILFIVVTLAWVFFRTPDIELACRIIGKIATIDNFTIVMGASTFTFSVNILLLLFFLIIELLLYHNNSINNFSPTKNKSMNIIITMVLLMLISLCGVTSENFVYFQF